MSVDFVVENGIAEITLNRPERLNAMDADAYRRLSELWVEVRDDPAIRVAIVTGAGERSFSTGADLKSYVTAPQDLSGFWLTQHEQLLNRGLEVWKPVIAAVNGYCLGGGMTLMLATDIRIAVPHATFGLTEVKRGILAGNGGTQRVLEQLPFAIGMELLLTGRSVDAATAARWGLVNEVVERDALLPRAREVAAEIAANAPLAVQATKELAVRSRDLDRVSGLRLEQAMNRHLQQTEDAREGPAAFAERRPAAFLGR
ncbi:MAG: enoyl-CoA hydratase-related protein [Actinomycetota bacterium]|jgi:enoyl-CoA hydratase/carnithine racemase|nr:enoyl-CoA hydratase-related protein [Actinomycetota bacterium]